MIATHGPYSIHIINADDAARWYAWQKPQRRLTWYLLVCNLSGREQIAVNGQTFHVPSNASYIVAPGALVDLASATGNRPVWIHFEVQYDQFRGRHPPSEIYTTDWPQRSRFAQPQPRAVWGTDLPVLIPRQLQRLFAQGVPRVVQLWKQQIPLSVMESQHALNSLLLALVAASAQKPTGTDLATRFARAEALARESLGSDFGVPEFAAAAGLSRTRFSVLYHQHTGRTPAAFLRQLRIDQAKTLLANTHLPIRTIGQMIGYHDPTVLTRVFRQATNTTPGTYRLRTAKIKRASTR